MGERSIKLMEEYNNKFTKNEQNQFVLQVKMNLIIYKFFKQFKFTENNFLNLPEIHLKHHV